MHGQSTLPYLCPTYPRRGFGFGLSIISSARRPPFQRERGFLIEMIGWRNGKRKAVSKSF